MTDRQPTMSTAAPPPPAAREARYGGVDEDVTFVRPSPAAGHAAAAARLASYARAVHALRQAWGLLDLADRHVQCGIDVEGVAAIHLAEGVGRMSPAAGVLARELGLAAEEMLLPPDGVDELLRWRGEFAGAPFVVTTNRAGPDEDTGDEEDDQDDVQDEDRGDVEDVVRAQGAAVARYARARRYEAGAQALRAVAEVLPSLDTTHRHDVQVIPCYRTRILVMPAAMAAAVAEVEAPAAALAARLGLGESRRTPDGQGSVVVTWRGVVAGLGAGDSGRFEVRTVVAEAADREVVGS